MHINRRFLYAGVFLLALGAVLVAADLRTVDLAVVRDALRAWPLAIVLIGLALVVRRTAVALPLGLLAAATPGLVLGSAIAIGPRIVEDCGGAAGTIPTRDVRDGTFDGPAAISLEISCGTIDVSTVVGSAWHLDASNGRGRAPVVAATPRSLTIEDRAHDGFLDLDAGGDAWRLTLPTMSIRELALTANANHGRLDLAGAQLDSFELTGNASQLDVDLSDATVGRLSARANLAALAIQLPAIDMTADLRANGSDTRICLPPDVELRLSGRGFASGVTVAGVDRGDFDLTYQHPGPAGTTTKHIDLSVNASFSSIEIDPIGGCK